MTTLSRFSFIIFLLLPMLLFQVKEAGAETENQTERIAGVHREEALKLGEKMYREGILPSGGPMLGVVKGDIPVDSRSFSCMSCHRRSGMGSFEGNVLSPPVTGTKLYQPWSIVTGLRESARKKLPQWARPVEFRPAYTDETLAVALWAGENPEGKKLNDVMPHYFLDSQDMEIMVFYLKNLSAEISPGVTDTTLSLATVITGDVQPEDREAMLAPLQFFVSTWGRSRSMELRAKKTEDPMYTNYRKMTLAVWELKGPPESWREQLEKYYKEKPVFALLGGIASGSWEPIHRFSEDYKIPTLFPITDFPVISETDWYTLYFSKGLYQEGEATAKYLQRAEIPEGTPVVQVYENNMAGLALAKGFQDTWKDFDRPPPENIVLGQGPADTEHFLNKLGASGKNTILLLWLNAEYLSVIENLTQTGKTSRMVFLSSTLIGQSLYSLPEKVRSFVYITYPYRLPQDDRSFKAGAKAWLQNNKIPVSNLNIQTKMYDIFRMFPEPLTMIKGYFIRDYLLEQIDMMKDQQLNIVLYPSLSFGPGQRYASKGCYIVQLTEGLQPELVKRGDWVIH